MLSSMCMHLCALNRVRWNLLCMVWLLEKPVGVSRLEMLRENHVPKVVSGGLRTGTPISEHDFSCNFSHHISRILHVVTKEVAP